MRPRAELRSIVLPVGRLVPVVPCDGWWERSADFDLWVFHPSDEAAAASTVRQANPPRGNLNERSDHAI